jgi:hypothetical protein
MADLSTWVALCLRSLETRHRLLFVSLACSCSLGSCTTAVSVIVAVWSMSCLALDLSSSTPTPPPPLPPIAVAVVAASVSSVPLADGGKRPSVSSVAQDRPRISGYGMRAVSTRLSWLYRRRASSSFRVCSLRWFADRLDGSWISLKVSMSLDLHNLEISQDDSQARSRGLIAPQPTSSDESLKTKIA